MGVITIEVPQSVKKTYRISSEESGKAVISGVEKLVRSAANGDSKLPGKTVSLKGLVGLWADRPESAEEIAREIRRKNSRIRND